jgi:uncharacterized protein YigE (DUF2233 family)
MRAAGAPILTLLAGCTGAAVPDSADARCAFVDHAGRAYVVCSAEAGQDEVRLWLRDTGGDVLGTFERLETMLAEDGERLGFAMNAGMYHPDRRPVGLYVEEGAEQARLITARGPGNFGMLPNGVFCIGAGSFAVIESTRFAQTAPRCRFASQSGPMLVIDGALHPRFLPDATSRLVRNGVGVSADGQTAHFAISEQGVTFHEFARLFRDVLDTPQALYFDGNVSRLHAPGLGRSDGGRPMGPIVGVVTAGD